MIEEKKVTDEKLIELENSIEQLKVDYSQLIAKVESIKADMKVCQDKVERSV